MDEERKRFVVVISPEKYRPIPSAIYKARLCGLDEGVGHFEQLILIPEFEILEGKYKDHRILARINKNAHGVRGMIWQLIHALTGERLSALDEVDLEKLVGEECFINVEQKGHANAIREYISPRDLQDIKRSGL